MPSFKTTPEVETTSAPGDQPTPLLNLLNNLAQDAASYRNYVRTGKCANQPCSETQPCALCLAELARVTEVNEITLLLRQVTTDAAALTVLLDYVSGIATITPVPVPANTPVVAA